MEKKDFKYGNPSYYIDNAYVLETSEYLLIIDEAIFDDDTVAYADGITKKFLSDKDAILNYMLENRLRDFYKTQNSYSDAFIINNMGRPQIRIYSKKDDKHPNWKFNYAGVIDFCQNNLDDHIISIEFVDDLKLDNVQIDG